MGIVLRVSTCPGFERGPHCPARRHRLSHHLSLTSSSPRSHDVYPRVASEHRHCAGDSPAVEKHLHRLARCGLWVWVHGVPQHRPHHFEGQRQDDGELWRSLPLCTRTKSRTDCGCAVDVAYTLQLFRRPILRVARILLVVLVVLLSLQIAGIDIAFVWTAVRGWPVSRL